MTDLVYPHTLVPGTPENVQDVQDNFEAVRAKVNGAITLDNLAAEIVQLLIPTGFLMCAARGTAPSSGWLLCDGASYPRSSYAALASVIGSAYGGDAVNFNVPDLQGRVAVGKGTHTDVDALGDSDGSPLASRRPRHGHSGSTGAALYAGSRGGQIFRAGGVENFVAITYGGMYVGDDPAKYADLAHTHAVTVGQTVAAPVDSAAYVVVAYFIKT